jgi:hypothetical protein
MPVHKSLTPFMSTSQTLPQSAAAHLAAAEAELLNLIAKVLSHPLSLPLSLLDDVALQMPGVIIYRESKARLEQLKKEFPALFSKRALYVEVLKMLDNYTFKLVARREVLKLFSQDAKLK